MLETERLLLRPFLESDLEDALGIPGDVGLAGDAGGTSVP